MSKGLGYLQRAILETLDLAKAETIYYTGSARQENYGFKNWKWDKPGWVFCEGCRVRIADSVYDLRASMKYLALKRGHTYCCGSFVEPSFQTAFSRAVRQLFNGGFLVKLELVPLAEYDGELDIWWGRSRVMLLADGLYLAAYTSQSRFVMVKR